MPDTPPNSIDITCPDDMHLHLRDGEALARVLPHTARQFGRAIIMPNLKPPVVTVAQAAAYRQRILAALPQTPEYSPAGQPFTPLMTLYLTDQTRPPEIKAAVESGFIHAVKLYPAGATTNSDAGLSAIEKAYDTLAAMQEYDLPLLLHGEVTDPAIDIFDREKVFIDTLLVPLLQRFPRLRVVLEHISTQEAAHFVAAGGVNNNGKLAATITAHHLLYNRNAMLVGGMRPHYYCLPILKREQHRQALLQMATSGKPCFFLGTDSAPHARSGKEQACGCAGCYTAFAALELYAEAFASVDALDKLEAFASFFGPDFYRLPRHSKRLSLRREPWQVPAHLAFGDHDGREQLVPLAAGESLQWRLVQ